MPQVLTLRGRGGVVPEGAVYIGGRPVALPAVAQSWRKATCYWSATFAALTARSSIAPLTGAQAEELSLVPNPNTNFTFLSTSKPIAGQPGINNAATITGSFSFVDIGRPNARQLAHVDGIRTAPSFRPLTEVETESILGDDLLVSLAPAGWVFSGVGHLM